MEKNTRSKKPRRAGSGTERGAARGARYSVGEWHNQEGAAQNSGELLDARGERKPAQVQNNLGPVDEKKDTELNRGAMGTETTVTFRVGEEAQKMKKREGMKRECSKVGLGE